MTNNIFLKVQTISSAEKASFTLSLGQRIRNPRPIKDSSKSRVQLLLLKKRNSAVAAQA